MTFVESQQFDQDFHCVMLFRFGLEVVVDVFISFENIGKCCLCNMNSEILIAFLWISTPLWTDKGRKKPRLRPGRQ
jgi:hypothetical protein